MSQNSSGLEKALDSFGEDMMPPGLAGRLQLIAERLENEVSRLGHLREGVSSDAILNMLRSGITGISDLIQETRAEVAGLMPTTEQNSRLTSASGELDALVGATEQAAVEIMAAAEKASEAGQRIRKLPGLPADALHELEKIDGATTDIFMACSFQDLTGQRIRKVVQALTYIEARVASLASLWEGSVGGLTPPVDPAADRRPDAHLMNGPSDSGLGQNAVDDLFGAAVPSGGTASQNDIDSLFP